MTYICLALLSKSINKHHFTNLLLREIFQLCILRGSKNYGIGESTFDLDFFTNVSYVYWRVEETFESNNLTIEVAFYDVIRNANNLNRQPKILKRVMEVLLEVMRT